MSPQTYRRNLRCRIAQLLEVLTGLKPSQLHRDHMAEFVDKVSMTAEQMGVDNLLHDFDRVAENYGRLVTLESMLFYHPQVEVQYAPSWMVRKWEAEDTD